MRPDFVFWQTKTGEMGFARPVWGELVRVPCNSSVKGDAVRFEIRRGGKRESRLSLLFNNLRGTDPWQQVTVPENGLRVNGGTSGDLETLEVFPEEGMPTFRIFPGWVSRPYEVETYDLVVGKTDLSDGI